MSSLQATVFRSACFTVLIGLVAANPEAKAAFTAVRDYDENAVQSNTIEAEAAGNNVSLAQFKLNLEAAFDAGLGGLINYDNDPTWLTDTRKENFDVTFASGAKTLNVDRNGANNFVITMDVSATPVSGNFWQGWNGSGGNSTLVFSLEGLGGAAAPLIGWGITGVSRSADRAYTVTFTHDDASTFVISAETVAAPAGSDDTFFGYLAPAGRTIASVNILTTSSNMALDEMAFILKAPAPPLHAGDFDGDGDVDGADFVAWQTNFPKSSSAVLAAGDADGDGDVDGADFVVWQTNFPFTPGQGQSSVPEPAAAWLFSMGSVIALLRCGRQRKMP
jgi:hypothetical protein